MDWLKKSLIRNRPLEQLELDLNFLRVLLNENKVADVKSFLNKIIKSYKSNSEIVDQIYVQQLLNGKIKKDSVYFKEKDKKVIKLL